MSGHRLRRLLLLSTLSTLSVAVLLASAPGADEPKPEPRDQPADTKEVSAKLINLTGEDIPLAKALSEVSKQSGIPVEDRRDNKKEVTVKLDLHQATFWQAVDAIAREADARVNLFQEDNQIALVNGPFREQPVSYNGIFRVAAKRITAVRDLETDAHFSVVTLEVTWEPGFRPFFIDTHPQDLVVTDDKNRPLETPDQGGGRTGIEGRTAEIEVRMAAPPRSVTKLSQLKGTLTVVAPSKWLTFTFGPLGKIKNDAAAHQQKKEGVSCTLSKTTYGEDVWSFEMSLEYPKEGPKFESFESWLVYNQIFLQKEGSDQRFPNNGGFETGDSAGNRASIAYHFVENKSKGFIPGKPDDWEIIYRTPGPIKEIPIPFEFKDLLLP